MRRALVLGGGGFIGSYMVRRLKSEGFWVRSVDLKYPEFSTTYADEFLIGDLQDPAIVALCMDLQGGTFDEIYQLAADMGGAGYIFTGVNDSKVMHNSALINLNVVNEAVKQKPKRIFYSSSACIYPDYNQMDPENPKCNEDSAYPAKPDSEYGWEKLFSERLYLAFMRNHNLQVRIGRYHNIFGSEGTWEGGNEKVPAALCRKVAQANDGDYIEVWGDGKQTRSFLHIDECIEATIRFMRSDFIGPVNIGSEELISISDLARMIIDISGKQLEIKHLYGREYFEKYGYECPKGVNGRNSDNKLYREMMKWEVSQPLIDGIIKTYKWIKEQVDIKVESNKTMTN